MSLANWVSKTAESWPKYYIKPPDVIRASNVYVSKRVAFLLTQNGRHRRDRSERGGDKVRGEGAWSGKREEGQLSPAQI